MKFVFQILILILPINVISQIEIIKLNETTMPEHVDFYHLKMPGGNEQNSINQLLEDGTGQMWIATKDGLIRYNGKRKYVYRYDAGNPNSIWHNFVTKLFLDKNDNLWVGTHNGLSRYRPGKDDFIPADTGLNNEYITDIQQDSSGVLWVVNHKKKCLFRFDPLNSDVRRISFGEKEHFNPEIIRILIDGKNRFFLSDGYRGIIRYFPETGDYRFIKLIENDTVEKYRDKLRSIITKVIVDRDNPEVLWIGTNLGFLIKYDLVSGIQQRLVYNTVLDNHGFHCYNSDLYRDDKGNIWITTWFYGTFMILPEQKEYIRFLPDPGNEHSISNTITTAIYQDKAGYLWFGTEYQGVDILKKNKKFNVFPSYPPEKDALPPSHFLSLTVDGDGRIWVGAEGGIFTVDRNTLKSKRENSLFPGATRFFSLYYDKDNKLWTGTENGLYCIDENGKTVRHFIHKKGDYQSISCNLISTVTGDAEGNIWIGTFCAGLVKYNLSNGKFYRFTPDKTDPKSISHPYVHKIFIDRHGRLWAGTADGLNKFNSAAGNFSVFRNDKTNPSTIGSSVINDINETGDSLWIATQGGGLNLLDLKTGTFKRYTVKDGLPDNNVKAILTDNHGNLWFSTTKNIVRFNHKTGQFVTYTASDGLENRLYVENMGWQSLGFYEALAYKDKQGYLYFGGAGGLLFFHPDSLPVNTYQSQLIIDEFKVNGIKRNISKNKVVLKPGENQLEVEFTLMNLIQSEKNSYAWKLVPYDTIWHHGDYLSKASYFNLPPGNYQLYYKAANNDGVWSVAPAPLQIQIKPHFYQTTFFTVLILLLILILISAFLFYQRYVKIRIEKKRKMMRYSWSKLNEAEARKINDKLLTAMQNKSIYLEPDLSLNKLAEIIHEKPNYLSQVINQFHKQNFFEFVNSYRIEEAKRLLRETSLKVEAVAYDSGFNSLSTFNSVFKKTTKLTPSSYRKRMRKPENISEDN